MSIDLKPYFDAARAADEEVQRILNEMNTAFNLGTDEGKQQALDLRPKLDEARTKATEANQLYTSMRDASATSDSMAKNFVPANGGEKPASPDKVMTFEAFQALDAKAKMAFTRGGGQLID